MAKFNFFSINCQAFDGADGNKVVLDSVTIQISKRVNNSVMAGEKSEDYSVQISDLPFLFQSDVKFPAAVNYDCSARCNAVREFLAQYLGQSCTVEEITKGKSKLLTYLEF